jgi:hypothetical protein
MSYHCVLNVMLIYVLMMMNEKMMNQYLLNLMMIIDTYLIKLGSDFYNFVFVYHNNLINIIFDDHMLN